MAPEAPYSDIGERLAWLRELHGMTQKAFAATMGTGRTTYNNWECGASRLSLDSAMKLREVYGVSLDFLFFGNADALALSLRKAWMDRPAVRSAQ